MCLFLLSSFQQNYANPYEITAAQNKHTTYLYLLFLDQSVDFFYMLSLNSAALGTGFRHSKYHHKTLKNGPLFKACMSSLAKKHLMRTKQHFYFFDQIRSIWFHIKCQPFSLQLTFNKNHLFSAAQLLRIIWLHDSVGTSGTSDLRAALIYKNRP